MKNLQGKVAVVTGASRGVGKGVALGLAEQGATVYITGRTEKDGESMPPFFKGTNIHQTAGEVDALGGKGIAVRCDHASDDDVAALFARIEAEQGKLDILVNNAWAGAQHVVHPYFWNAPFWEQPIALLDDFYMVGQRSSYVCSQYAAAIMAKQCSGLIVNISLQAAKEYLINPVHGIIKAAVDKMTADTAHDLKEFDVKVFSLYPGTVATEGMREIAKQDASVKVDEMETPQFVGRCVAALALADNLLQPSGSVLRTAEIAQRYGVTEIER